MPQPGGMPLFIPDFIKSTLALLGFTWAGAAGLIDNVEVRPHGIMAESQWIPPHAIGDFGYYGMGPRDEQTKAHEYGHLMHEDEIGRLYLPLATTTSLIGNLLGMARVIDPDTYYNFWTERRADELGGVNRNPVPTPGGAGGTQPAGGGGRGKP